MPRLRFSGVGYSLILLDRHNGSAFASEEAILNFGPSTASAGSNSWWSSGPALGNSWSAGTVFPYFMDRNNLLR
jgi:hypothetical protein